MQWLYILGLNQRKKKLIWLDFNVCTLMDRDRVARPKTKTSLIVAEPYRCRIDIAAPSKTWQGITEGGGKRMHILLKGETLRLMARFMENALQLNQSWWIMSLLYQSALMNVSWSLTSSQHITTYTPTLTR